MISNCITPLPINFNCWKHHAGFIKAQVKSVKSILELDELKTFLLKIGDSQMDLYLGNYSPEGTSDQLLNIIHQHKINSAEHYKEWLERENKHYRLVKLKDKSLWTLRLGDNAQRYIHIHPGRYSPHTVRVKAATLKTAIFILCFKQIDKTMAIETEKINLIRTRYLSEPPIKSFSGAFGLKKLIDLLMKI